uniref:NADH dehydrogenase subunit 6 n=1 Tax=Nippotaenia mogurndae TaxID=116902 RepID=UPI0021CCBE59|nr:NADH dehydrogenase subunit 6 [Nippotaenia mogurndae]UWT58584.1 NADH dehydrogenase subunit 6 [Nippotaenia mogurndae]
MLISVLFFFYFLSLTLFLMLSHPIFYCGLLVVNAVLCSFICYLVYGFSWYALLFCLVYIGGVYILFVFVSVHNPNSNIISGWNFSLWWSIGILWILCAGFYYIRLVLIEYEFSSCLCTFAEGNLYIVMCLTLLFGFVVLSLIMSVNLNYYR